MDIKKVAWVVPSVSAGSGGLRTIFTHAAHMVELGLEVSIHVASNPMNRQSHAELRDILLDSYGLDGVEIFPEPRLENGYDLVIATSFDSVDPVVKCSCPRKIQFGQDFERLFFPMNDMWVMAENAFGQALPAVTIGRWLASKLNEAYGTHAIPYDFCADKTVYRPLQEAQRENAICVLYQPEKPRRASQLLLSAVGTFCLAHPETKVYFYGSTQAPAFEGLDVTQHFNVEYLGLLSPVECNALYNRCRAGVCFSLSNPSRIPFEMMAAGLPVIELHRGNNLFDFPEKAVLLTETNPESVATAMEMFATDDNLCTAASEAGIAFMANRPIERELDSFIGGIERLLSDDLDKIVEPERIYHIAPVAASAQMIEARTRYDELWSAAFRNRTERIVADSIRIRAHGLPSGRTFLAAVWYAPDQRDINWQELVDTGDAFEYTLNLADHDWYSGVYQVHIYERKPDGEMVFIRALTKEFAPEHAITEDGSQDTESQTANEKTRQAGESTETATPEVLRCEIEFYPIEG